jgi:hypothetical protein
MKFFITATLVLFLTSCANSPSSIAPASVASAEYDHLSCDQLAAKLSSVSASLEDAIEKQNSAQAADAFTVFLILIPVSALAGDNEAEVARYKGEKLALQRSIERRCT